MRVGLLFLGWVGVLEGSVYAGQGKTFFCPRILANMKKPLITWKSSTNVSAFFTVPMPSEQTTEQLKSVTVV